MAKLITTTPNPLYFRAGLSWSPAVPRSRDWSFLARSTRRRWVAAYGGRGEPEQRADRARIAYETGEHLSAEQSGHESRAIRNQRTISAFAGPGASFVEIAGLNRAEVRRVGRFNHLVGMLAEGRMTGAEFQRRVSRWRPVAGLQLTSNPEAILTALEARRAGELEIFSYESGRAS